VLAAATTGAFFTKGCEAIVEHIMKQCHDVHHGFNKWVVEPGTGRFYLVPNAELTHTVRLIATALQELLPTAHILAANENNPQTTTFDNHTDRPFLRLTLVKAITLNSGQHHLFWNLTLALINEFQTHEKWVVYPGAPTTDTAASSSTAPAPPTPVPLQRTEPPIAGSGPYSTKAPPHAALTIPKASAPSHPDTHSG